jgi:hypothetical protein
MASVTATTNDLLAQHLVLISRLKESQKAHRRKLRTLPSPPLSILNLPTIPSPKPSPPPSPPSSPLLLPRRKPPRADLQPAKRARAIHYENYVPEEETIRNDCPRSSYMRQVGTFLKVSKDPGQCKICCTFPAAMRDEPYDCEAQGSIFPEKCTHRMQNNQTLVRA